MQIQQGNKAGVNQRTSEMTLGNVQSYFTNRKNRQEKFLPPFIDYATDHTKKIAECLYADDAQHGDSEGHVLAAVCRLRYLLRWCFLTV